MSRRSGIALTFVFYGSLVVYFIYETKMNNRNNSFIEFLEVYLYNVQKQLFNINLVITFLAYYMKMPVLKAEYRIRHGRNFTRMLFTGILCRCIYIGVATFLFFGLASFFYQNTAEGYFLLLKCMVIVMLYTFSWGVFEKVLYLKTENLIVGLVGCATLSFMLSIIHGNMVFNDMVPGWGVGYMTPFVLVAAGISIISSILIVWMVRRKECLA